MARSRALRIVAGVMWLAALPGCDSCDRADDDARAVWLAGVEVQRVRQSSRAPAAAAGVTTVELTVETAGASGTATSIYVATLDAEGLVRTARYLRTGPGAQRSVLLTRAEGFARILDVDTGQARALGTRPVVVLELMDHVVPRLDPLSVLVVDLAAGETLPATLSANADVVALVDDAGAPIATYHRAAARRDGPGRFVELPRGVEPVVGPLSTSRVDGARLAGGEGHRLALAVPTPANLDLDGPHQTAGPGPLGFRLDADHVDVVSPAAAHTAPDLFIESDHPEVKSFAAPFKRAHASATALALAEEIHRRLVVSPAAGPPSALDTAARFVGDCDNASALLVASLRSLGVAARPVVGYRVHDDTLVPHAWAEAWDGERWFAADATVPGIGGPASRVRLFEGLGSALSMGRVLEAVTVVPVPGAADEARDAAP